jgi:protein phosphatase PTC2/3
MDTAIISEKGIRLQMEDDYYLNTNFGNQGWLYLGIYDGHNGSTAAAYAAKMIHKEFLKKLDHGLLPKRSFLESYEEISSQLSYQESGTVAVDILIKDNMIYCANVGDARSIVVSKKGLTQLTVDHRIANVDERERIEKSGGIIINSYVSNGVGGLMPTRTIGDQAFKSIGVIAAPSLKEHEVSPDDLILLTACDGLFDYMSNEEVAALAMEADDVTALLDYLKREVLINRGGFDNLTVIAVRLSDR